MKINKYIIVSDIKQLRLIKRIFKDLIVKIFLLYLIELLSINNLLSKNFTLINDLYYHTGFERNSIKQIN